MSYYGNRSYQERFPKLEEHYPHLAKKFDRESMWSIGIKFMQETQVNGFTDEEVVNAGVQMIQELGLDREETAEFLEYVARYSLSEDEASLINDHYGFPSWSEELIEEFRDSGEQQAAFMLGE